MAFVRAVLLDRDGTLIEDRHYLADPAGVVLLPGVGSALARLARDGRRLFMVSNQSGVGRGYFDEEAVRACQRRLEELLGGCGVRLDDAVWCPHAPEAACSCRKPLPGLIFHSDRGVQYAAYAYRQRLASLGIRQSMSRKGDPYDNAVAENFFSCLKCECVHLRHFASRAHAMADVFAYIETFYNPVRPHSSIGWRPPDAFARALSEHPAA